MREEVGVDVEWTTLARRPPRGRRPCNCDLRSRVDGNTCEGISDSLTLVFEIAVTTLDVGTELLIPGIKELDLLSHNLLLFAVFFF